MSSSASQLSFDTLRRAVAALYERRILEISAVIDRRYKESYEGRILTSPAVIDRRYRENWR